jgi:hypothetical protein
MEVNYIVRRRRIARKVGGGIGRKLKGNLMQSNRISAAAILFIALITPISQFAQEPNDHWALMGLLRTINTLEVTDFSRYGSYATWETLLERHQQDLNGWAAQYYTRKSNVHVAATPEILPGWDLRLNVQLDGQGYIAVLEDSTDKSGYAGLIDERAIIRECKYLQ